MSRIPNSVMPHAMVPRSDRAARNHRLIQLYRIATAPAFLALGASVLMFEHLRRQLVRGWSKAEG